MSAVTKDFHVGAILSITGDKMIWPVAEWHELLDWMTGDVLLTHQLPRAAEECTPELKRQHPALGEVVVPDGLDTWDKCEAFVAEVAADHGDRLPVAPLAEGDHTRIDPISELKMMKPDMPIIPVVVDGDDA